MAIAKVLICVLIYFVVVVAFVFLYSFLLFCNYIKGIAKQMQRAKIRKNNKVVRENNRSCYNQLWGMKRSPMGYGIVIERTGWGYVVVRVWTGYGTYPGTLVLVNLL